jgi:hypothetical protein
MALGLLAVAGVVAAIVSHFFRCAPGTYGSGSECLPCGEGHYRTGGLFSACTECPVNYHCPKLANPNPIPCARGSVAPMGSKQCKPCAPGTTASPHGRCEQCPANFYCPDPAASPSPIPCPRGAAASPGSKWCTPCPQGSTVSLKGYCEVCPPGSHNHFAGEPCVCSEGFFHEAHTSICKPCPVGRWVAGPTRSLRRWD